jgi:DNA-binding YbaB/EbfC family protein
MLKGLGDLGNIMKLQNDVKKLQKELKKNLTEGKSSDGMITAIVNGEFELKQVTVNEETIKNAPAVKIEKNILEAVNNAVAKNKKLSAEKMKELTGGMDLGALGNMF